jgi:hypothetical protein
MKLFFEKFKEGKAAALLVGGYGLRDGLPAQPASPQSRRAITGNMPTQIHVPCNEIVREVRA